MILNILRVASDEGNEEYSVAYEPDENETVGALCARLLNANGGSPWYGDHIEIRIAKPKPQEAP